MAFLGKVALVTGGGSGMGQRACLGLARQGALVAALDVNEEGLAKTAAAHTGVSTFACDVSDTKAVYKVVAEVEEKLGPIDRTMAAAAIMPTGLAAEQDIDLIHKIMDINYKGVVNTVRATLPGMLERRFGDQVIFSSLMGFMPVMYLGAYCASKFAVRAFAEILYHENRDSGIRFALVAPPAVNTPLMDQVTSPMKTLEKGAKPLTPAIVLAAIEKSLDKGEFVVAPGQAKGAMIAQRLVPSKIWDNMHKIEGF